jgi:hypothetical protein
MRKYDIELNRESGLWEVTFLDSGLVKFFCDLNELRDYLDWQENIQREIAGKQKLRKECS